MISRAFENSTKAWIPVTGARQGKPDTEGWRKGSHHPSSFNYSNYGGWRDKLTIAAMVMAPVAAATVPVAAATLPVAAAAVPVAAAPVPVAAVPVPVAGAPVPVAAATVSVAAATVPVAVATVPVAALQFQ